MRSKDKHKVGVTPRRFDPAYKAEAVLLWEANGLSAEATARELGISVFHLYDWRKQLRKNQAVTEPRIVAGQPLPEDKAELQAEVKRLRLEVRRPTERREILKKAAGILRTAAERYALITMLSGDHPVKLLCETLHVSRSGYYAWRSGKESLRKQADRSLSEQIQTAYLQSRSTYGSPRITASLRSQGHAVGWRRVARLMREAGLRGRQKRRYRVVTTDSGHEEPIARNLLAQRPPPRRPDEVWVTDITYLQTDEGWLYLAGVLDRCTRRLIGWAMDSQMDASLAVAALEMAVQQRQPSPGVIHHSDRGIHYACAEYRERLAVHKMVRSMSRAGNCYDNGAMEAFWSTMKNEMVYRRRFLTRAQARSAIFEYIEGFYNRTRLHSALGFKSPLDYETNLT